MDKDSTGLLTKANFIEAVAEPERLSMLHALSVMPQSQSMVPFGHSLEDSLSDSSLSASIS
jgi:hypothetical protein